MLDYLRIMLNGHKAKMDERGASAVEYGLLIAGIAALIVVAVFALGPIVKEAFTDTCNSIHDSNGSTVNSTSCGPAAPPAGS
jgi:pilus assembly protein Flp/PilA